MLANLLLEQWLNELKIDYEKEKPFLPENDHRKVKRAYRFDYYLPEFNAVIEIDGAVYKGKEGGHTSGKGYERGCCKQNYAVLAGYALYFRFPVNWFTQNVNKAHQMPTGHIYNLLKRLKGKN